MNNYNNRLLKEKNEEIRNHQIEIDNRRLEIFGAIQLVAKEVNNLDISILQAEKDFWDLDYPERTKEIIELYNQGYLNHLEEYEKQNWLAFNPPKGSIKYR